MVSEHVIHTIPPTFDERSRVLVLGSIPSPKSREAQFNYGHPQNRFWKVMAALAGEPEPSTVQRRRDFCLRHHIALWDVLAECDIEGASDASIRNPVANDLRLITKAAPIEAVYCTGAKAFEYYRRLGCEASCGLPAVKLPSTSPANAACKLDELIAAYAQVFDHEHRFEPPVLDVERVVKLERQIAEGGTSLAELMDRAGAALAHRIGQMIGRAAEGAYQRTSTPAPKDNPLAPRPAVTFLCGSGNNGGDGWVAAEILAKQGIAVVVVTGRTPSEISAQPARDAAVRSMRTLEGLGGRVIGGDDPLPTGSDDALEPAPVIMARPSRFQLNRALNRSWVIADAILGTGFDAHAVKEPYHSWIAAANNIWTAAKLAVDVPSGVSAQRGYSVADIHARFIADETITMIAPKPGLAAKACGEVSVAPLAYIEPYLE